MEDRIFERFRDIVYDHSGIVLSDEKKSLLIGRIQKRLRARGLKNEKQYLQIIETDYDGSELIQLIDAISTNTTYFWREPEHFQIFKEILKSWAQIKKNSGKIWCAASSSGQEPYTLASEVIDVFGTSSNYKVLATDVSTKVLKLAQSGSYTDSDIQKLPVDKRSKYFSSQVDPTGVKIWSANPVLKNLVLFKQLNLVTFPYPLKGPIDVIFCRNVMIYFDIPTRQKIVDEFWRLLAPGGFLFLSLSESLLGIQHSFKKYEISVYQK